MLDAKLLQKGYNSLKKGLLSVKVSLNSNNPNQIINDLKTLKIKADILIEYVNKNR